MNQLPRSVCPVVGIYRTLGFWVHGMGMRVTSAPTSHQQVSVIAMQRLRLTQFSLKTIFLVVLVSCYLANWHGPTLYKTVTHWLNPSQPQRVSPSDYRVFTVRWQSTDKQQPSIKSGDLVEVVWIPADGSAPQTIFESVTMIILNHPTAPPRQGTGLVVTPQQLTTLQRALKSGTVEWYPVNDG